MTTTLEQLIAEKYIQLHPVSWETFNQLVEDLGDNRNKRLTYYQKTLQITSPLRRHENNNRFID